MLNDEDIVGRIRRYIVTADDFGLSHHDEKNREVCVAVHFKDADYHREATKVANHIRKKLAPDYSVSEGVETVEPDAAGELPAVTFYLSPKPGGLNNWVPIKADIAAVCKDCAQFYDKREDVRGEQTGDQLRAAVADILNKHEGDNTAKADAVVGWLQREYIVSPRQRNQGMER